MLTVTALIFAAVGWAAFAKEYRAHRETESALSDAWEMENHWLAAYKATRDQLTRLTGRDERGRFVKREGV